MACLRVPGTRLSSHLARPGPLRQAEVMPEEVLGAPRVITGSETVADGAVVLVGHGLEWVGPAAAIAGRVRGLAADGLSRRDDHAGADRQPRAPRVRRRAESGRPDAGRDRRAAAGADAAQRAGPARRGRDHRPRPGRAILPGRGRAGRHRRGPGPGTPDGGGGTADHRHRRALLVHGRRGRQRGRPAPHRPHPPQARRRPDQGHGDRRVHDDRLGALVRPVHHGAAGRDRGRGQAGRQAGRGARARPGGHPAGGAGRGDHDRALLVRDRDQRAALRRAPSPPRWPSAASPSARPST